MMKIIGHRIAILALVFTLIMVTSISVFGDEVTLCELNISPQNIVITSEGYNLMSQGKNCSTNQQEQLMQFFSERYGTVTAEDLTSLSGVKLNRERFEILSLEKFIKQSLKIDDPYLIHDLKFLSPLSLIKIQEGEEIKVSLLDGNEMGERNIKLLLSGSHREITYWATMQLYKKIKTLVATSNLSPMHINLNTLFKESENEVKSPEAYFSDLSALRFYKLNRNISEGTPLRASDLIPQNLVLSGTSVNVLVKNKGITVRTTAYSKSSGKLNDFISLEKTKGGSLFTAKVIDYNSVRVDL